MPALHLLCICSRTERHRLTPALTPPPLAPPQELRYLTFTPVGQNALRRFMADAFAHVQSLDAAWLTQQSTGELSRVFSRGVRGMNTLLRLMVFNVLPTAIEVALSVSLNGRDYTPPLTYSFARPVAISEYSPACGPTAGGTTVQLSGVGLRAEPRLARI